jgi:hypothetical protein
MMFLSHRAHRWVILTCWMAAIQNVPALAEEASEEGFVQLFPRDGAPQGWVVRHWSDVSQPPVEETSWTVRDGVLHGSPLRGTWLISEQEYADFELKFEFKLGPLGNSGCALRAPGKGDPAFDGLELQMADLRYNESAKPSELTGGLYRAVAPIEQVYRPTEWNEYHIKLVGPQITVVLNGTKILDLDLSTQQERVPRHDGSLAPPLAERPRRGHIGFQELGRGDDQVQIRNARLRVLEENTE